MERDKPAFATEQSAFASMLGKILSDHNRTSIIDPMYLKD
jgi:hypothetical protein